MLASLNSQASWPHKLVYANTWLFEPLLKVIMSRSRETNAIIRTTTAATIVRAGVKVSGSRGLLSSILIFLFFCLCFTLFLCYYKNNEIQFAFSRS